MKEVLYYVSMLVAGLGLGIYTACAILYGSGVPFDVMKKQGVVKAKSVRSVFWLCVVLTGCLVVLTQVIK